MSIQENVVILQLEEYIKETIGLMRYVQIFVQKVAARLFSVTTNLSSHFIGKYFIANKTKQHLLSVKDSQRPKL